VACPAVKNFPTVSHKRHDFRYKLLNVKCVFGLSLQSLPEIFLILKEMSEIWSKMYIGLQGKYPLFLSDFMKFELFLTDFQKKILKYQV